MLVKYELPREPDERYAAARQLMGDHGFPSAVLCNGRQVEIDSYTCSTEPLAILGLLLKFSTEVRIVLLLDIPFRHISSVGAALLAA